MKNTVCCFTGHRTIREEDAARIIGALDSEINRLVGKGVRVFRSGGAMGFDTLAALCVIKCRQKNPDVRLTLFLPCRDQARFWGEYEKGVHEYIIANADEVVYTSDEYWDGCMLHRNRLMVEGSGYCVAYCYKSRSGTAHTVAYARERGIEIINVI
ncbi:MAG: DUF1273 domain-containing protein [Ruminococcaceae bacterium]|nr:DUF1273 domain-containing protein [Oscillospiraceae bacterium]